MVRVRVRVECPIIIFRGGFGVRVRVGWLGLGLGLECPIIIFRGGLGVKVRVGWLGLRLGLRLKWVG